MCGHRVVQSLIVTGVLLVKTPVIQLRAEFVHARS